MLSAPIDNTIGMREQLVSQLCLSSCLRQVCRSRLIDSRTTSGGSGGARQGELRGSVTIGTGRRAALLPQSSPLERRRRNTFPPVSAVAAAATVVIQSLLLCPVGQQARRRAPKYLDGSFSRVDCFFCLPASHPVNDEQLAVAAERLNGRRLS